MWGRRQADPPPPATRLSADEAAAIALGAVDDPVLGPTLTDAVPATRDDAIVWTVTGVAIGSVPQVEVDDATGAVLAVRRVGLR